MLKLPPSRLLIICLRRIGDVLLVTPLIRTVKRHWPSTEIDLLVFKGTEGVLLANPDIHQLITVDEHPTFLAQWHLIKKIFRAYDLALSTLPGDKPTLYAYIAGRYRIGMLGMDKSRWWKRWLLAKTVEFDDLSTHTVLMNLRLAEVLQLTPCAEVVVSWHETDKEFVSHLIDVNRNLAILHPYPKFAYKEWVKESWLRLADWLQQKGYTVIFTGDKSELEKAMVAEFVDKLPASINMVARLSLSQLGFLLSKATIYIGPDTVITHMAAALGIPTIALFGPTNPVKWGPWPKSWALTNPFVRVGSQHRNNVYLMQGPGSCVPCFNEGCEQHIKSYSRCLQDLTAEQVISKISLLLNKKR